MKTAYDLCQAILHLKKKNQKKNPQNNETWALILGADIPDSKLSVVYIFLSLRTHSNNDSGIQLPPSVTKSSQLSTGLKHPLA